MLRPIPTEELESISEDINAGRRIDFYKHHAHPDVRAMIAKTNHAPQAYILDESPEVRLALICSGKWLDRIAPIETNPILILELIKNGQRQKKWLHHENASIRAALGGEIWKP
ncbi:hypothetical protein NTH44_003198 [Vibrio metoecus]|nr:hypothetical protein [Vibrio cholerae]